MIWNRRLDQGCAKGKGLPPEVVRNGTTGSNGQTPRVICTQGKREALQPRDLQANGFGYAANTSKAKVDFGRVPGTCLVADDLVKLLGEGFTRKRPKARARSSTEDERQDLTYDAKLALGCPSVDLA